MIKGIIFDMDNTLLRSTINFEAMKSEVFDFLVNNHIIPIDYDIHEHTTSTLIEYVRAQGISDNIDASMMQLVTKHELSGMRGAGLEPAARQLLEHLYEQYVLVVITNNSVIAAQEALENTKIKGFFHVIIGREQMTTMKPSPSGFRYVMQQFPTIKPEQWISIGDSWIDGQASMGAGIPFISYRADSKKLQANGVQPLVELDHLLQLIDYLDKK